MTRQTAMGALVVLCSCSGAADAQWLKTPTAGLPRQADGTPNLSVPAPRGPDGRPDLSGIWTKDTPGDLDYFYDLAKDLKPGDVVMTPWAAAIAQQRVARKHIDDPWGYCTKSPGVPRIDVTPVTAFKVLQTPGVTVILYDLDTGPVFRQLHTDGRALPENPEPLERGYSIGRWDGDQLVVTTAGFRDGGWLDTQTARPHSDALRVTERFRRVTLGHMDLEITIDDPKAFEKPWTVKVPFRLVPDTELIEGGGCDGHDKTMEHRRIEPQPPEPPSPR